LKVIESIDPTDKAPLATPKVKLIGIGLAGVSNPTTPSGFEPRPSLRGPKIPRRGYTRKPSPFGSKHFPRFMLQFLFLFLFYFILFLKVKLLASHYIQEFKIV
jgi:hypothetical protein